MSLEPNSNVARCVALSLVNLSFESSRYSLLGLSGELFTLSKAPCEYSANQHGTQLKQHNMG